MYKYNNNRASSTFRENGLSDEDSFDSSEKQNYM
jgi:hypothetical protein